MNKIRDLRIRNEYTQQKIADYLKVSKMTYIRYEKGITEATESVIIMLADLFKVSADYLLGRTNVYESFDKNLNNGNYMVEINGLTIDETKKFYELASKIQKD